jgi:putative endonuclease
LEGVYFMKCYTYIIKCKDDSLYTGWTNNIEKRMKAHNDGTGAKYTRGRGPVTLVHLEVFDTKEEAMRREAAIKKLSKKEKLLLVD